MWRFDVGEFEEVFESLRGYLTETHSLGIPVSTQKNVHQYAFYKCNGKEFVLSNNAQYLATAFRTKCCC